MDEIEDIISAAKLGKMFVISDDEGRENEGDLMVPACFISHQHINFMITHGKGLVCLSLTDQRIKELGLPMMVENNKSSFGTNFTTSIGAKYGVTTGISTFDRAKTIQDAIRGSKDDIVSPGHVFPLKANDGGVLMRSGHTEAIIDICKLADLYPAGVICEIIKEDGTMARMDDLKVFAKKHGLLFSTIEKLKKYIKDKSK